MKKETKKVVLASFLTVAALVYGLFSTNVKPSNATYSASPTPSCGTFVYEFGNDGNNGRVDVDFEPSNNQSDRQIDVSGINGWTVTKVELDVENDNHSGYFQYSSGPLNNFNPNPGDKIDDARVTVTKSCPTPTPQGVSVNICHQAGQSGNYTHNTVSVHSVNDANGLNGHGGHNGDIWAPFTYNNVNYPGQGNYGSFNMSTCVQNSTSTPTATPTWTPTATPFSTWTPTASPTSQSTYSPTPTATPTCEGEECNESTPTPEATATPTPNGDICANLDGIQLTMPDEYHQAGENCLKFELGGAPTPPPASNTQVLGASTTGKVLGASTMAGTGAVEDAIFNSMFTLGSLLTSFGIMKNGKKKS